MRARAVLLPLFPALVICATSSSAYRPPGQLHAHAGHAMAAAAQLPPGSPAGGLIAAHWPTRHAAPRMAATIDGAVNPAAIPDAVAYGHFIRATAASTSATDLERRAALLTQAGLTAGEQAQFAAALGDVGHELQTLHEQLRAGPPPDVATMQTLQQRQRQVLADAEHRLRTVLPPAVLATLDAHIQSHVKRRIKIYQGPMQ
jgi:hypothetical protein